MAEADLTRILHRIRRAAAEADPRISDAQLLERFAASRDEAAFELLVWRHRRLVFSVCWRVLSDFHDAEDAFQATFLALARKAGSIGKREALAGWLYKVAYRAALTLRSRRARRASREQSIVAGAHVAPPGPPSPLERGELAAVVDEELSRLPQKFRVAAVLCYLEGKTVDEAARQLGCPRGTLASRLARARERLRTRLASRGLALSAGAVVAALSEGGLSAAAPEYLVCAAVRTVALYAAGQAAGPGISLKVAALTEEVLRTMFFKKLATGALVVVCMGAVLLGGALTLKIGAHAAPEPMPEVVVVDQPPVEGEATEKQPRKKELQLVVPPKPVTVSRPMRREFTPYDDFTGRLLDGQLIEVRTRISGRLKKINSQLDAEAKRGRRGLNASVKKGDLLFELDPTEFEVELTKAQANLDRAREDYQQAKSALEQAHKLFDKGMVARSVVDKSTQQVSAAEAAWNTRQLDFDRARQNLEATRVLAPADAYEVIVRVRIGQIVSGGPKNPEVLATIRTKNAIAVRFEMDEVSYLRYQRLRSAHQVAGPGSPLHVGLADEDNFPHEGILDYFEDHLNPETATIRVYGFIADPDPLLLPGMFARVRMPFGKPRPVLEIPDEAITSLDGKPYVLVVNDRDVVEERKVKIGPIDRGMRVIQEGLRPEDWVVTKLVESLHTGDKVERRRPASRNQKQQ